MNTSEAGLKLIRSFEGLRLKAYRCQAGIWTSLLPPFC
jgi:GH24 family phage-related lysozyme (muramidase)